MQKPLYVELSTNLTPVSVLLHVLKSFFWIPDKQGRVHIKDFFRILSEQGMGIHNQELKDKISQLFAQKKDETVCYQDVIRVLEIK